MSMWALHPHSDEVLAESDGCGVMAFHEWSRSRPRCWHDACVGCVYKYGDQGCWFTVFPELAQRDRDFSYCNQVLG